MTVISIILSILFLAMLVTSASFIPKRSRFSDFELERRKQDSSSDVMLDERRESLYVDIVSLQRVIQAILLVGFVLAVVSWLGWFAGGLVAVIVSLEYGKISATPSVRSIGQKLYDKYEAAIMSQVTTHRSIVRWFRTAIPAPEHRAIDSREELEHLVEDSHGILSGDEKKLILSGLSFDGRSVHEIMTPKSVVDTIQNTEMLGPLVLDDLHKTGHSRFPVVDGDIDHVVGVLYVHDVLTLDTSKKHTSKVETAMSRKVYYIREDHSLGQALTAFLSTHHHLFIVINEFRETVGIVTLEDTLEALLGRRIIDEFDAHDDMRAVATRNAVKKTAHSRSADSKDV